MSFVIHTKYLRMKWLGVSEQIFKQEKVVRYEANIKYRWLKLVMRRSQYSLLCVLKTFVIKVNHTNTVSFRVRFLGWKPKAMDLDKKADLSSRSLSAR